MSTCPVPITSQVLNLLNIQLHTFRKCFTGKEFVDKLIKLGQETELSNGSSSESPSSSGKEGGVSYTGTSAVQLGQYLLNEGILICLLNYHNDRSTPLESSSSERINAVNTTKHATVLEEERPPPSPIRPGSHLSDSTTLSPTPPPSQPPQFQNRPDCWYKFSDLEDSLEGSFLKRAQILSVCSRPPNRPEQNGLSDFEQARLGTLYLLLDVFHIRSRKDSQAKRFLQQPNVILTSQQRTANNIPCYKIFRI